MQDIKLILTKTDNQPEGLLSKIVQNSNNDFVFVFDGHTLSLQNIKNPNFKNLLVDFNSDKLTFRRKYGGGFGENIAKAIGIKTNYKPKILDTTAGLGTDSFIFASLGSEVTMIERNSIIFDLLNDGLKRGKEINPICNRMNLIFSDAVLFLKKIDALQFDVIYIDPMFPEKNKTQLAKKEMQFFQKLVGQDLDADKILKIALEKSSRVVVKRPKKSAFLNNLKPTFQIVGESNRFDIYLITQTKKCL